MLFYDLIGMDKSLAVLTRPEQWYGGSYFNGIGRKRQNRSSVLLCADNNEKGEYHGIYLVNGTEFTIETSKLLVKVWQHLTQALYLTNQKFSLSVISLWIFSRGYTQD